jgi:hypothetical protein
MVPMAAATQADAPSLRRALVVLLAVVLALAAVILLLRWVKGYAPLQLRSLAIDARDQRVVSPAEPQAFPEVPAFEITDPSPRRVRVDVVLHNDGSLPITVDGVAKPFGPKRFVVSPDITVSAVLAPNGRVEIPAHATRTVVLDLRTSDCAKPHAAGSAAILTGVRLHFGYLGPLSGTRWMTLPATISRVCVHGAS